jgi:hypothetical protein
MASIAGIPDRETAYPTQPSPQLSEEEHGSRQNCALCLKKRLGKKLKSFTQKANEQKLPIVVVKKSKVGLWVFSNHANS